MLGKKNTTTWHLLMNLCKKQPSREFLFNIEKDLLMLFRGEKFSGWHQFMGQQVQIFTYSIFKMPNFCSTTMIGMEFFECFSASWNSVMVADSTMSLP